MASGFLPEIEEAFREHSEDSDSEEEFEGFDLDDLDENRDEISRAESFSMDNWAEGERDPVDLNFASYAHCTQPIDDSFEPVDFFNLFLSQEDYETMADETNRYAEDYLATHTLKPSSRFRQWKPTTWEEMKVFTVMTVAMGLVVQLDFSEYWTTDEVTQTPIFWQTYVQRPSLPPDDIFSLIKQCRTRKAWSAWSQSTAQVGEGVHRSDQEIFFSVQTSSAAVTG